MMDAQGCCRHEEEVALLQEKLTEVHRKLIDQLDVCREQEIRLIQLSRNSSQASLPDRFDTFNYQSFGQAPLQENVAPNSFHSSNSTQSHQVKTDLLQADLQAMRHKVLAQITEKNRFKEELREVRASSKKMALEFRKLQGKYSRLEEEHQHLAGKYEKVRRSHRSSSELDRVSLLLAEAEDKYSRERDSNRQLQARCRELEGQLLPSESYEGSFPESQQGESNYSSMDSGAAMQQREMEYLKAQVDRINSQGERRQKGPRRGFEQTKDLIRKLQETESRVRRRPANP